MFVTPSVDFPGELTRSWIRSRLADSLALVYWMPTLQVAQKPLPLDSICKNYLEYYEIVHTVSVTDLLLTKH